MRIIINHLTRMAPGYICVAGVDPDTGRHIRPVIRGRLPRTFLTLAGGPFDLENIVDIGSVTHIGRAPETEDHLFTPANARMLGKLNREEFWKVISDVSEGSWRGVFGDTLEQQDHGFAISENKGTVSLGCLRITTPPDLETTEFDGRSKIRMHVFNQGIEARLSVTDIRFYERDQITPKFSEIERVAQLLREGEESILSVGLARAWVKPGDTEPRHWLQLNNIHFRNHSF
jgi:hypothetical protein